MGGFGGGSTTQQTTSTQGPPQISPYSVPGYQAGNQFYQNLLQNPPVYPGPTLAPPGTGQIEAIDQTYNLLGGGPSPLQQVGNQTLTSGAQGSLFNPPQAPTIPGATPAPNLFPGGIASPPSSGVTAPRISLPNGQAAFMGLATPFMQQFESQILPGITARSLFAGQGPTSTREQAAQGLAINQLGQGIATGAAAPIYQAEVGAAEQQAALEEAASATQAQVGANIYGSQVGQNVGLANAQTGLFNAQVAQNLGLGNLANSLFGQQSANAATGAGVQLGAAGQIPGMTQNQLGQLQFLSQMGGLENFLMQQPLTAAQTMFQQPTAIQSQAANALLGSTITGGGSMAGSSTGSQNQGILGTLGQLASIAAIAGIFMSSEKLKRDIEYISPEDYLEKVRRTPLAKWNYSWEPPGTPRHTGPIVEYAPKEYTVGGMAINPLWYAGELHAAMKELDQKVDRVERALFN